LVLIGNSADVFENLTDTGRRWDGWKVSIRDKVEAKRRSGFRRMPQQEEWEKEGLVFCSTKDIIRRLEGRGGEEKVRLGDRETGRRGEEERGTGAGTGTEQFPDKVMFTFHPQRWHSSFGPWMQELVAQNVKNVVKRVLVAGRRRGIRDEKSEVRGRRSEVGSR